MNLFQSRARAPLARVSELKALVAEHFRLPEDAAVMLTELQCTEPGCPPLETVIAILTANKKTRQYKLHKGITEISEADILGLGTVGPL
jgi:hypothetical protein